MRSRSFRVTAGLTNDKPVVRDSPPRDPSLEDSQLDDHHVGRQKLHSRQNNESQTDRKDESFHQPKQTGIIGVG